MATSAHTCQANLLVSGGFDCHCCATSVLALAIYLPSLVKTTAKLRSVQ